MANAHGMWHGACAVLAGAIVYLMGCGMAAAETVTVGKITAEHRGSSGIYLTYDGVPVLRGGLLQLFAETPGDSYSAGSAEPVVTVENGADGARTMVAAYKDTRGNFQAEERFRLSPDDTVAVSLRCTWKRSEPACVEWALGKLWAYPLTRAKWTAAGPAGETSGVIAERAADAGTPEATLARGFRAFAVKTGAFNLAVEAGPNARDLVVLDGRRDRNAWAQGDRLFWLGCTHGDVTSAAPLTRTVLLRLGPGSARVPSADHVQPAARAVPFGRMPPAPDEKPLLIPQPKDARIQGDGYRVGARTRVIVSSGDERVGAALGELLRSVGVSPPPAKGAWTGAGILVAVAPASRKPDALWARIEQAGLTPPDHPQGYRLRVDRKGIAIVGRDAAGAYYGVQTLRQLARASEPGSFHGADIADWPCLAFRGAHLFVGNQALPFHRKLIDLVFSPLKMNALVLECEYTRWDTDPAIAVDFSMSKADLAADAAYARSRFLEPIPLVNCLGHAEWLFQNGRNLDLAEDPERPYAVRVTEDATYKKLFGILDEALAIFHPRYLHIGHDEMTNFGRFPYRAETKALGSTPGEAEGRAFEMSLKRLSEWLKGRGVATMLWGDMLLNRSEAQDAAANAPTLEQSAERRKVLLPGTVIADWHYDPLPPEQFVTQKVFAREGFPVVATTWYTPENIRGFNLAAIRDGAMGSLQSTWAGYNSWEGILPSLYEQFTAFVLAAEYSWSGTKVPVDQLPYSAADVFKRAWRQSDAAGGWRSAWYLDLGRAAVTPVEQLRGMPLGRTTLDGVPVRLEGSGETPRGLVLWGRLAAGYAGALPRSASLAVGRAAKQLVFVHSCLVPSSDRAVGAYVVHYADGATAEIPLNYGDQIRASGDAGSTWSADPCWSGTAANGEKVAAQMLRWRNPRPSVVVRTIEVRSLDAVASPVLLAVTGLE